eukprot:15366327-Ditylum_brightwellii.AAC.1
MSAENQQSAAAAKCPIARTRDAIFNRKFRIYHFPQKQQLPNPQQPPKPQFQPFFCMVSERRGAEIGE